MEKIKDLTVLVTTLNEERNIRDCLRSVPFAGSIFVVDSGSTDNTVSAAREFTSRVVAHPYEYPARQKNWALKQIETEWVLILDADERVSPELAARMPSLVADVAADGFDIKRRSYFFGKIINHCGWDRDYVLRLFRTRKGLYPDIRVHEAIQIQGLVRRVNEPIYHHTYNSFEQYREKSERYTTWAAQDLYDRGAKASWWKIRFKPCARFFRQYFLQAGFLDGREGFILCRLSAHSVFMKYAKLWEMNKKAPAAADGKDPSRTGPAGGSR